MGSSTMDSGIYYALLRFEEAALALRTIFHIEFVQQMADDELRLGDIQARFGWTSQATRTMVALLRVMQILDAVPTHDVHSSSTNFDDYRYRCSALARDGLGDGPTSRRPYLSMGSNEQASQLAELLRGNATTGSVPLYAASSGQVTLMDDPQVGREIAIGLGSRARQFAQPLMQTIVENAPATCRRFADLGAGSPYVAQACLAVERFDEILVVDRENAFEHFRDLQSREEINDDRIRCVSLDFFKSVPEADVYLLSNTAHDWLPSQYDKILENIRAVIPAHGLLCLHEPLLKAQWESDAEWMEALWMACYALTLFKLTHGMGSCYTLAEHDAAAKNQGFKRHSPPVRTCDGCTALLYQPDQPE